MSTSFKPQTETKVSTRFPSPYTPSKSSEIVFPVTSRWVERFPSVPTHTFYYLNSYLQLFGHIRKRCIPIRMYRIRKKTVKRKPLIVSHFNFLALILPFTEEEFCCSKKMSQLNPHCLEGFSKGLFLKTKLRDSSMNILTRLLSPVVFDHIRICS